MAKTPKPPKTGLSDIEAADLTGVSRETIRIAKSNGRINKFPDGSVSIPALEKWLKERRSPRGGARNCDGKLAAKVAKLPAKLANLANLVAAVPMAVEADDDDLDNEDLALNLASTADGVGDVAAKVLLQHGLPPNVVLKLCQQISVLHMAEAAAFADDLFEPPPEIKKWAEHRFFVSDWPTPSCDWPDLLKQYVDKGEDTE